MAARLRAERRAQNYGIARFTDPAHPECLGNRYLGDWEHSIPAADIARRFPRSLRNLLDVYAGAVDHVRCFLNSGPIPDIVFVQNGADRTILNHTVYDQFLEEAKR